MALRGGVDNISYDEDIIALIAHMNDEEKEEYELLNHNMVQYGIISLISLIIIVIILLDLLKSYLYGGIEDIIVYVMLGIFTMSSILALYNYSLRKKHLDVIIYKMGKKYRQYKSEDWKERMPDYKEEKLIRKSVNIKKKHHKKSSKTIYCSDCGAKVKKGVKFCSDCGGKQ